MFDRAILANYAILAERPAKVAAAIVDLMAADPDRLVFADGVDYYVDAALGLGRYDQIADVLPAVRKMSETAVMLGLSATVPRGSSPLIAAT